ncbi:tectonin domain-containing protein [Microbispora sp. NPDC049633]|uniref:tectonin domain-containing protein n=1 Tax=Microbispora sp. NPDC049633 TaxID=3154355 RepID=UPI00344AE9C6
MLGLSRALSTGVAVLALGGTAFTPAASAFSASATPERVRVRAVEAVRAGEWERLPGLASRVAAGSSALWGISPSGVVQQWTGTGWTLVGDQATRISVSTDGLPWIVRSNGNIFRRTSAGQWQQVTGTGVDIGAGGADNTWTLGSTGGVFRWNGSAWTRTDGSAVRIAAGGGSETWIIDPNGSVYRRSGDRWQQMPGSGLLDIAVASPARVAITTADHDAYLWTGSDWRQLTGIAAVSIAINDKYVYAVDPAGRIWKLGA